MHGEIFPQGGNREEHRDGNTLRLMAIQDHFRHKARMVPHYDVVLVNQSIADIKALSSLPFLADVIVVRKAILLNKCSREA